MHAQDRIKRFLARDSGVVASNVTHAAASYVTLIGQHSCSPRPFYSSLSHNKRTGLKGCQKLCDCNGTMSLNLVNRILGTMNECTHLEDNNIDLMI